MTLSQKELERQRRHYRANRAKILAQKRKARLDNPKKFRARDRKYCAATPKSGHGSAWL
jgi:hypothetical protein